MPAPEVVPRSRGLVARAPLRSERAHPLVQRIELRQIALVPVLADVAREPPPPSEGLALVSLHLLGRPQRLAAIEHPSVEGLETHEYGRTERLVALAYAVPGTLPRVLDRERCPYSGVMRVVAAPGQLRVLGIGPFDGELVRERRDRSALE